MDIQPQTNQSTKPISDDQELAKVLAGVSQDTDNNMGFEETPVAGSTTPAAAIPPTLPLPPVPANGVAGTPVPLPPAPMQTPAMPSFNFDESMIPAMPAIPGAANNNLDGIRKEALTELRPLVDKLNLAPEEKFDIYLLLLRSTDDTALIAPAHEAAKNIADESKRAEALLDVIKEIDFLSSSAAPTV